ncbi:hypothetical protein [Isoptericola sp. BMS4]|uniref:hypothetical protein n=1 Tax=Isoptericola sp. BMS4 TaxID=2527875 RepID=UPI00141F44D5|nr:hypothetical protein [Isoptericola sp. BMS4]
MTDLRRAGCRLGAYLLPGDPTWLARTLPRYYDLLDVLVVPVPADGLGWTGAPVPVAECLATVHALDTRGIVEEVPGTWQDPQRPLRADTAQRQAALDALVGRVDWVLQLDNDELLPDPAPLLAAVDEARALGLEAVEWPMRVLYRRTARHVLEVCADDGGPFHEYPGPVAVRAGARLVEARRTDGPFLRVVVAGDRTSLQVRRPPGEDEYRRVLARPGEAIVHDSWARTPAEIRRKTRSWGHARDTRFPAYYWLRWWPSPVTWRWQRDLHPFSHGLWPRLRRVPSGGLVGE